MVFGKMIPTRTQSSVASSQQLMSDGRLNRLTAIDNASKETDSFQFGSTITVPGKIASRSHSSKRV